MNSAKSHLLACTAIAAALTTTMGVAFAATPETPFAAARSRAHDTALILAQTPPPPLTPAQIEEQKRKAAEEAKKKAAPPPPPAARPAPPPPPAARPAPPPPPAARPAPPPPPAARPVPPPQPPAVRPATPPAPPPPPAVQQRPPAPATPPPPPPAGQTRPNMPPPPPPGAQLRPTPPAPPPPPAAQGTPPASPPPPPPAVQGRPGGPGGQGRPIMPPRPGQPPAPAPAASPAPNAAPAAAPAAAAPPPPATVRNANEFIRRGNAGPAPGIADVRQRRQESRDGDRVIIREGDRTIVRNDNRTIIQHNESSRFAIGARTVRTENRGDQRVTVVERPGGVRITSYSDRDGRLTRRVRRDRNGRETVLIDNLFAGAIAGLFISALQPPTVRIPRETYIIDGYRADRRELYDVFIAPPVDRLEQRYTLDQVRYNAPLREYMRRVDLDVNFDSGSWQLTPSQIDRLADVADGLNRAISRNPREIFLIEGHTDTVGNPDDNLSLSDRRAEAVAVVLTERFQVPSENLVTQGYGEEYPKEQVDGPSRINRRVAIRRITPLIDQTAQR